MFEFLSSLVENNVHWLGKCSMFEFLSSLVENNVHWLSFLIRWLRNNVGSLRNESL